MRSVVESEISLHLRNISNIQCKGTNGVLQECEPEKWNSSAGRKLGSTEDVMLLNAYLDTLQSKVYDVHKQLIETGRAITAESVKNVLVGSSVKPKMILEIFKNTMIKCRNW